MTGEGLRAGVGWGRPTGSRNKLLTQRFPGKGMGRSQQLEELALREAGVCGKDTRAQVESEMTPWPLATGCLLWMFGSLCQEAGGGGAIENTPYRAPGAVG